MDNNKEMIEGLVSQILDDYHDDKIINQQALFSQPDKEAVCDLLSKLIKIMYPGYFKGTSFRYYNLDSQIAVLLEDIMYNLRKQVVLALPQNPKYRSLSHHELVNMSEKISNDFFKRIPKIRALVETDVAAFFDGDPAAYNYNLLSGTACNHYKPYSPRASSAWSTAHPAYDDRACTQQDRY